MRFKEFITEDKTFDIEQFEVDCAFYLERARQAKQFHKVMRHGTKSFKFDWDIVEFKERSNPKQTPEVTHGALNRFFTKRFGFPFRNGLFTTANEYMAMAYGKTYAIFPIGEFEWLCNTDDEYVDLTSAYVTFKEKNDLGPKDIIATTLFMDKVKAHPNWKHNEDLAGCLNSDSEIMIKCDKFYAIWDLSDEYEKIRPLLK